MDARLPFGKWVRHGAGLDLLAGGRYLPPRQQTLRETIAWSYNLLTPTEQRVFRYLGVFAGGCTLKALQAVLAHGAHATDDNRASPNAAPIGDTWLQATLRSLVNQSLILQAPGPDHAPRFSLLEMLREYALEQLERQREAEAVQRAHADYYLQAAARFQKASAEGTAPALLGSMTIETDNLRAGLQWAREYDWALELRFAAALSEFWSQRQELGEGRQWLEQLLPRLAAVETQLQPEQMPRTALEEEIVCALYRHFADNPTGFERCAAGLASMMDANIIIDGITQPTVDGGRDAIGRYRVGPLSDPVEMEFALEAKCYSPGVQGPPLTTVGVSATARLISRLRHRQFGILVTTSVVSKQAYAEIRQDRHPAVVLCGRDLAQILIGKGLNSAERVEAWLRAEFTAADGV